MQRKESWARPLTVNNFRREMKKLFTPHQQKIEEASQHFKEQYREYKNTHLQKKSLQYDSPINIPHQRTPSLLSQFSEEPEQIELNRGDKVLTEPNLPNTYDLSQWHASKMDGFKDSVALENFYNELFSKKKVLRKSDKRSYDFKKDEKQILCKLFQELKGEDDYATFENIIGFFSQCKLYYLCYNIRPQNLQNILKESAHQQHDRLSKTEFLNIFFTDRPNILDYFQSQENRITKRCVLSEQGWKELKNIFATLDTFGNETIYMAPFIYKVKNNHSNRALINEAAIEYPQINRTISIKKVIFNLEHRYLIKEKIEWKDIQNIFLNYEQREYPSIDLIYKQMIQKGQISKFTNYFMLSSDIIQEIKRIYYRCPKYCQFFVKTSFICKELLESMLIKKNLKEAIVRIIEEGSNTHYVKLEDQIRTVVRQAEDFIDLDELLQYFSIKGLLNTGNEEISCISESQTSEEQNQLRLQALGKQKCLQKIKELNKSNKKGYKPVRHLTVCQEFQLSQKNGESTMQKKTRLMREQKLAQNEKEMKSKFKANPIPAELNPERYKAYIKKIQEQRQLKKQQFSKMQEQQNKIYQYLKTNTMLFVKKQSPKAQNQNQPYVFSSKPLPWFVTDMDMLEKINQKKILRRKRLHTEAKVKMLREWKNLPDVAQQFSEPSELDFEDSERQQDSQKERISKVKEVPNFKQLHKQFAESLEKKKQQWKATVPIEFNLCSPKPRRETEERVTETSAKGKKVKTLFQASESPKHKASVQTCIMKEKINISTTLKYQDMINFNQEKMRQQLEQKQLQLREQKDRREKQKNFAKFMRKKLKQSLHKSQSLHNLSQSKIKKHKQSWKQLQRLNQQEMCRMYSNVMNRPFLFQNSSQNFPRKQLNQTKLKKVPLLKKGKKKQSNQATSKHIHQSPLKAYQAQNYEQSLKKAESPLPFMHQNEEQSSQPYLNQSF